MKSKFTAYILAGIMVFSLAGCGNSGTESGTTTTEAATTDIAETTVPSDGNAGASGEESN